MPALRKKIALFFLSLFLLVSVVTQLPPPAHAQCPSPLDPADQPYCDTAVAACAVADIINLFGANTNLCLATVFEVGRALFAPPPPTPWYDPTIQGFAQKVFDPNNPDEIFGERYTYAQVNWIIDSLVVWLFPPLRARTAQELFLYLADIVQMINNFRHLLDGTTTISSTINLMPKYGFVGQTYYLMAQIPKLIFTDKIASGVDEVKYMAGKFSITAPVYAQGLGYDKLNLGTIKYLWIATRNLAYLISTVILIAAGFMVIFRTRISPQVSVTVQMIIPRLVISLVLVTFSYAIVGFVIDMIYVFIAAILGFLYWSQGAIGVTMITDLNTAITQLTGSFSFVDHFLGIYIVIAILLLLITVGLLLFVGISGIWTAAGPIIVALCGAIMGLFMWSVYVWARILGQLVVAYLSLILLVVAGPLMIILDILPTSKGGFKKWLSCVIGNASVFATYSFLAIISSFLFLPGINGPIPGFAPNNNGNPQITSTFSLPNFSGGTNQDIILKYLIFMGFMSAIPNIVNAVKNMFCKSADFGNFIENTVKDTIGQITKAGQAANEGVQNYKARQQNLAKAADAISTGTTDPGSTGNTTR
jgi:hypothetical protein